MTGAAAGATPRRSARRLFATTVLTLEAFVAVFAALVAFGLRVAAPGLVFGVGGGLAALCLLAAALVRRGRAGYALGWAVQVLLLLSGLALPAMVVLGAVFAIIWAAALRVGASIDVERVERERTEAALAPDGGGSTPAAGGAR